MHVSYDSSIIQKFADRLYVEAQWIIFGCTCLGFFVGAGAGLALYVVANSFPLVATIAAVATTAFAAMLGYRIGSARAFGLKLQAQLALCQAHIEQNTAAHVAHIAA